MPLLTPTLLRSCCRLAPCSPCGGENFPPPPPLRVGSARTRGGGVAAVHAGPERRWVQENQPGACAPGGHQLHQHRLGGPGGSKGGRPSPSRRNSSRILGLSFWQDLLPRSPQQQDPQGLIPISPALRPQNSGCSLLGPRSQLHPRAPLPLALLPTHTTRAQLPPRRLNRRFLATARMRPTPARDHWSRGLISDQLVCDLEKVNKIPFPRKALTSE